MKTSHTIRDGMGSEKFLFRDFKDLSQFRQKKNHPHNHIPLCVNLTIQSRLSNLLGLIRKAGVLEEKEACRGHYTGGWNGENPGNEHVSRNAPTNR
jgi:hypothetical protein